MQSLARMDGAGSERQGAGSDSPLLPFQPRDAPWPDTSKQWAGGLEAG